MSASPNLKLPFIDANQNQKSVTHNAALAILDALVHLQVQSRALAAPPSSPGDGKCWIVAPGGLGAWAGQDGNIAAWQDGAWAFYPPNTGFVAFVDAEAAAIVWNGTGWTSLLGTTAELGRLGIGTAPAAGNPLSAKLNGALFAASAAGAGGTGDVRLTLSKETVGNTASLLFQNAYSGRAEFGLCGNDGFHLKVSLDGGTWTDALRIAPPTGAVTLSGALQLAPFTVANLPAAANGALAFAANGRKGGEAAGAGTGVPVAFSNGAWRRVSDDSTVAA